MRMCQQTVNFLVFLYLVHLSSQKPPGPDGDLLISETIHWIFIFSDSAGDQMFHMGFRGHEPILEIVPLPEGRMEYLRSYGRNPEQYCRKYLIPETKRKGKVDVPRLGELSHRLAKRLNQTVVYFHATRCNCKHYVDYVVYGTTFGSWLNPTYMPINEECPLHLKVTPGTNIDAPEFGLKQRQRGDQTP